MDDTGLAWANRRQLPLARPQYISKAKETSLLSDEIEGNETAGEWAKSVAEGTLGRIENTFLRGTGFAHMTGIRVEAKA